MRRLLLVMILGLGLTSRRAHAQDIERARQLFQEASSLREAGMYSEAVSRLRQAIAIKDTPGLEYHAGFCEAKLGHFRLAIKYYERAAALLRAGAAAPDVISLLPPAHEAALEQVARIRISVRNKVSSVRYRLDDEAEQPYSEGELLVDAGRHRLTFSASGFKTEVRDVTVAHAEQLKLDLELTPDTPESALVVSAPTTNGFPWKTVSIGLGLGVTAGGIGLGIVSATQRHNAQGRINFYSGIAASCGSSGSACTPPQQQQTLADLAQASSDKDSATRWETVGFVSAGIGAAASIALWRLWPSSHNVTVAMISHGSANAASKLVVTAEF